MTEESPESVIRAERRYDDAERSHGGWWWLLLIVVGLLVAAALLMPRAIRYGIEQWLLSQGADTVRIQDVDYNPIGDHIQVHELEVMQAGERRLFVRRLHMNPAWWSLLSGPPTLERLFAAHAVVIIEDRETELLRVGGLRWKPRAGGRGGGAPFAIDALRLENTRIEYIGEDISLSLDADEAQVGELGLLGDRQPATVQLKGRLNDSPLSVEGTLKPFATPPQAAVHVEWSDALLDPFNPWLPQDWQLHGSADFNLDLQGRWMSRRWELDLSGQWAIAELQWQSPQLVTASRQLHWRGTGSIARALDARDLQVQWEGNLQGSESRARFLATDTRIGGELDFDGRLDFSSNHLGTGPRLQTEGSLQLGQMRLDRQSRDWAVRAANANWQGRLGYGVEDSPGDAAASGRLSLTEMRVERGGESPAVLTAERVVAEGLEMHGTHSIRVPRVRLEHARVSTADTQADAPVAVGEAIIAGLRWLDLRNLRLEQMQLSGLDLELQRTVDGRWEVPLMGVRNTGDGRGDGRRSGSGADASLQIGATEVTGNSRLRLVDRKVDPAFTKRLLLRQLSLGSLSTQRPQELTRIELKGRLDGDSEVALSGELRPFGEPRVDRLQGQVRSLNLVSLSPYAQAALDRAVKSGQLDAEIDARVVEGQLDGDIGVRITRFLFEGEESAPGEDLSPLLDLALAMVRDSSNNIRMRVPLEGEVAAADFSFLTALRDAFERATGLEALNYLKENLAPFDDQIAFTSDSSDKEASMRLNPLPFAPGSDALTQDASRYLDKLAGVLKQRPRLRVRICGVGVPHDLAEMRGDTTSKTETITLQTEQRQQLQQLAQQRADRVREQLLAADIDRSRFRDCPPRVDHSTEVAPQVALSF